MLIIEKKALETSEYKCQIQRQNTFLCKKQELHQRNSLIFYPKERPQRSVSVLKM
jgi:hypothetical protein